MSIQAAGPASYPATQKPVISGAVRFGKADEAKAGSGKTGDAKDSASLFGKSKAPGDVSPAKAALAGALRHGFSLKGLLWDSVWVGVLSLMSVLTMGLSLTAIPFVYGTGILFRAIQGGYAGYQAAQKHNGQTQAQTGLK